MNISEICDSITSLFKNIRAPQTPIPGMLLAASSINRPGVSAKIIASNIITRQSEAGAPVGANIDGSRNIAEAMEVIRVEEILKALRLDAKIEIAIPPGGIVTMGTGANAGGPVVVTSSNISPITGTGIIR